LPHLRDARDDDAPGLIALIGAVFSEYPGCVLDVDGELPELRRIASDFDQHGGRFWVAEQGARIVGCVGFAPSAAPGGIELKKLYVARELRQAGLGSRLVELVEREAQACGARFIELWSDTRFSTAHRFYEKRGWRRSSHTRELHDQSNTVELRFEKAL
jgi:putative acetyltransferase